MNAAQRHIARLYESTINRGLNVEDIRYQLAAMGIARSPAMVRHGLDNMFCFAGYAASHPDVSEGVRPCY